MAPTRKNRKSRSLSRKNTRKQSGGGFFGNLKSSAKALFIDPKGAASKFVTNQKAANPAITNDQILAASASIKNSKTRAAVPGVLSNMKAAANRRAATKNAAKTYVNAGIAAGKQPYHLYMNAGEAGVNKNAVKNILKAQFPENAQMKQVV